MKPLTLKTQTKEAQLANATFVPAIMSRIKNALEPLLDASGVDELNQALKQGKRRTLTLDDFAMIAYVHARSIHENDGHSPYERVKAYCSANGHDYDNLHVRVVTSALLEMQFMFQVGDENRKAHQCRKYRLAEDAEMLIKSFPTPKH